MIVCDVYTVIQNEKDEIYIYGSNYNGGLDLDDCEERDIFEKVEFDFGGIKNIACSGNHIVIQNKKNEIYACGGNYIGQFIFSNKKYRNKFKKVGCDFGEIKNMACGENYIVVQNEKNEIYVCGLNEFGQLGLGDNINRNKFEKVEYDFGEIKKISCGRYHIIIQNVKNEMYACGDNYYGQLGFGDKKNRDKFEKVGCDFGEIKKIACGDYHTIIQNEKNEIYVCGFNRYGQLGLGDKKIRNKFEKVAKNFGKIKNIVCGAYHTVIQNEKNEIYVCGYNVFGQLGLGDNKNRKKIEKVVQNFGEIKNITCRENHTVIQNEKKEIYICGANGSGQLDSGDNKHRNIFEKVDTDDIFEKIYNFELELNTEEIVL